MIRLANHRRRLIRKRVYRSPRRRRYEKSSAKRVNNHDEKPLIEKKTKKHNKGYKMSYRYKYYNISDIEEENDEESQD